MGLERLYMFVLDRLLRSPRLVLGVALLLTVLALPALRRIRLDGDVLDLLPRSSPATQAFAAYSKNMVAAQELVVLATCSDPTRLTEFADQYADKIRALPDVEQVTHRISADSLRFLRDHLLLLLPEEDIDELGRRLTKEALQTRAAELRGLLSAPGGSAMAGLLTTDPLDVVSLLTRRLGSGLKVDSTSGYLRTADGTALLLKIRPRFSPVEWDRDQKLMDDASALAVSLGGRVAQTDFANSPTPQVAFSGAYAFPPYFREWIEKDTMFSTVLSVGAVLLLFAFFFRSLRILPWVLLPLLLSGVWTAIVAALGFGRISGISLAFATILVAIGIDLPIQMYSRLRNDMQEDPHRTPAEAVRHTTRTIAGASIVATLGPAAVFFACGLSDFGGLTQLGVLAGVGLCVNCVAMLTVFPALLLSVPAWMWQQNKRQNQASFRASRIAALCVSVSKRPRLALGVALLAFVVALPQVRNVRVAHNLLDVDLGDMPPKKAQAEISRRFGEQQRFLVALAQAPTEQAALEQAEAWQQVAAELVKRNELVGYEAIGTFLPSFSAQNTRRQKLRALDLLQASERLKNALEAAGFDSTAFAPFLSVLAQDPVKLPSLTKAEFEKTELGFLLRSHVAEKPGPTPTHFVALYLFAPADQRLPQTLARLREAVQSQKGGQLTGLPLLETELRSLLARDLLRITLVSLGLVTALLMLYYRRPRPVLAVLLPLSLSWVLYFAVLVVANIPIHLYNLLSVPLVIGYGIDDHIFLVHRYLQSKNVAESLHSVGRAVVLTSLATMAGFLALLVAHFPGLVQFGLCGAVAVLLCLLVALFVLPSLFEMLLSPRTTSGS
jgi:predicted RND superfamily exporter protein